MASRRPLSKAAGPGPEDPVTQERQVADVVRRALLATAASVPEAVLESMEPRAIFDAISWQEIGDALMEISAPLMRVVERTAREEIPEAQLAKAVELATPIEFTLINALAVVYADAHAGRLVVEISEKLRQTVTTITARAVAGELPLASMVKILREVMPLHEAWALAVVNAAERAYASAMNGGATPAAARAASEKVAANRATALIRRRAQNIARTEAMTAMNEGKLASWHEQVANGWLSPDAEKEWIEGRTPCEICKPLVGEVVPWDQPFSIGVMMPPAHPSCRCTAGIRQR